MHCAKFTQQQIIFNSHFSHQQLSIEIDYRLRLSYCPLGISSVWQFGRKTTTLYNTTVFNLFFKLLIHVLLTLSCFSVLFRILCIVTIGSNPPARNPRQGAMRYQKKERKIKNKLCLCMAFPINTYLYILFNYCLTENLRPNHTTVKSVNISTLFLDMLSPSERVHMVSSEYHNFPT